MSAQREIASLAIQHYTEMKEIETIKEEKEAACRLYETELSKQKRSGAPVFQEQFDRQTGENRNFTQSSWTLDVALLFLILFAGAYSIVSMVIREFTYFLFGYYS